MAPNAAVVVRAPAQQPSTIPGCILKRYLPVKMPTMNGMVVTNTPQSNRLKPAALRPATNLGPVVMPTTAMKAVRPILLNTHSAGAGMRPKVGFTARK